STDEQIIVSINLSVPETSVSHIKDASKMSQIQCGLLVNMKYDWRAVHVTFCHITITNSMCFIQISFDRPTQSSNSSICKVKEKSSTFFANKNLKVFVFSPSDSKLCRTAFSCN
ncbi:hypothetical protein ATANTOWER_030533, partial [Ataeniobius toweri]|nr:hypothetical protein [Ataeniobius toweri]